MAHTPALLALNSRLTDARRLIEIHEECTGLNPGRRIGYDALNRSAVILAVAAWEGFVEESVRLAAKRISKHVDGPSALPSNVAEAMVAHLYQKHKWSSLNNDTKHGIWGLAGRGWRQAYLDYMNDRVDALSTPNFGNVKKLYSSTIGLGDFSSNWGTQRWSAEDYHLRLDTVLTLRHEIAHGTIGTRTVGKGKALQAVSLIARVAAWTDLTVSQHIRSLIS